MNCEIRTRHSVQITCLVRVLHVSNCSLLIPIFLIWKLVVGFRFLDGEAVYVLRLDSELVLIGEWHR